VSRLAEDPTGGREALEAGSCISCGENLLSSSLCKVACNHEYCRICLSTVVGNALKDEGLFPPRCCKKPFTMQSMRSFLSAELISEYHEKRIEYETVDRTYCPDPHCSTWLRPEKILNHEGVCPNACLSYSVEAYTNLLISVSRSYAHGANHLNMLGSARKIRP
jgi:hypothetical protein